MWPPPLVLGWSARKMPQSENTRRTSKPRLPSPGRNADTAATLMSAFFQAGDTVVAGYIYDPRDTTRRFTIELLLDGSPFRLARADIFVAQLHDTKVGD